MLVFTPSRAGTLVFGVLGWCAASIAQGFRFFYNILSFFGGTEIPYLDFPPRTVWIVGPPFCRGWRFLKLLRGFIGVYSRTAYLYWESSVFEVFFSIQVEGLETGYLESHVTTLYSSMILLF